MLRPESITSDQIERWNKNIDNDPNISVGLAQSTLIREVMYCGLWLTEKLEEVCCPEELIVRIQITAGQWSFGRDPWKVHQQIFDLYQAGQLEFKQDPKDIN